MRIDPDVKMTPGAWLVAFLFVLSIVFFAIVAFWAFVLLGQWFITFWFGRVI